MRIMRTPEMLAMRAKCEPYLTDNPAEKCFKEGTPEEIKELYKEYLLLARRQHDEEVAIMWGYSSVDEYYKDHPEKELKDIDLE